jgi:hypothetical protein
LEEEKKTVESTVAALLLVTSAVVFACVVVSYAVNIAEQTLNTDNMPQLDRIKNLENNFLNQTSNIYNQTLPELPNQPPP